MAAIEIRGAETAWNSYVHSERTYLIKTLGIYGNGLVELDKLDLPAAGGWMRCKDNVVGSISMHK